MRKEVRKGPELIDTLDLWDHQIEAVTKMRKYVEAYRSGKTQGAALVHMPTGTGKTRVIATLSRYLPSSEVSSALILAPRLALRDQLQVKLDECFFRKGTEEVEPPKTVLR